MQFRQLSLLINAIVILRLTGFCYRWLVWFHMISPFLHRIIMTVIGSCILSLPISRVYVRYDKAPLFITITSVSHFSMSLLFIQVRVVYEKRTRISGLVSTWKWVCEKLNGFNFHHCSSSMPVSPVR